MLYRGRDATAAPEWGSLDILEACGASDLGSNPSSGVRVWAWPGGGDIAGFILSFLGFLIAWRALDLVPFGLTIGESAILGAVISLVGLGISWFSHSPIDDLAPEVGHIDEIANAGFFGFSLGKAVQANP